ncbi:tetratricopeptide repeat protein [Desulfocapsa sulfexigens DSM 10523]|uniref:Tetratricopeptide repeat protein n=1 Tax=Desulfocapsa sulfexigens (strain DSM 10523 / SB164P1) TaxID=1167006 RepID=M1NZZ3_DESSD|nr:tetratricopeptide repeat protein [Desulfocapsa sulfexigens]AGF76843.1 tetratricopeptide repeat protein [Desulfocapsa sulfexigens DSM 10523]
MITLKSISRLSFLLFFILTSCATKDLTRIREEAYMAYDNKEYDSAADKFEILVKNAPEDVEFWFRLGNAYARSQNPQLAISAYQNALLRDPTHVKAWYNMGFVQTQTALKTFVDMQTYTDTGSPLGKQGKNMREGLFLLLEHGNEPPEDK